MNEYFFGECFYIYYRFSLNQLPKLKVFNLICDYIRLMTNLVMIKCTISLVRKDLNDLL